MLASPILAALRPGFAGGGGGGPRTLIAANAVYAPLRLTRAQTGGAVATADIDLTYLLLQPNVLTAPLTLSRAQAGGVAATGDA